MSDQETAKQHVVPKFYLKGFASDEGTLEVFNKEWKKFLQPKYPSAIGYDLYFYAQTTGTPDDISQGYEEILHSFENYIAPRYGPVCERILGNNPLSEEDKFVLAFHASTMWLRGYNLRQQINDATGQMMKKFSQMTAHMPGINEHIKKAVLVEEGREITDEEAESAAEFMRKGEYTIQGDNLTHLSMIGEYQGYTNLFSAQKMRVYIAEGTQRFITSDVPLVELLPKYATPRKFYGYGFLERLHAIPLSSKILLEFHDPEIVSGKHLIRRRINNDEVAAANARQLMGAQRWCAGTSKENFLVWNNVPGSSLPLAKRIGKFEENLLGMRVS